LDYAEVSEDRFEHDLRSGAFRDLLKDIRLQYDLVVFDVPAVHGGGDPRPAAGAVDATILTYDPSISRTVDVKNSIESLREARVNVIGLVSIEVGRRKGISARFRQARRSAQPSPQPTAYGVPDPG
jgi:Mrp family chromosome partitioning ATPase